MNLISCFFLLLWSSDEITSPIRILTVSFNDTVVSCTPTCAKILTEGHAKKCEYAHLQKSLVDLGCLEFFRNILSPYLTSQLIEDRQLANLAIGWSFYGNFFTSFPEEIVIPYFERYYELNGDDNRTIKVLLKTYVERGEIDKALSCAYRCDLIQIQKREQSLAYVRVLYLKSQNKNKQKVEFRENSPQNWLLAVFTYTYLRATLGLSPEQIIQKDTIISQYLKRRCDLSDSLQEEDLIFYWRGCFLTIEERKKYNQATEKRLNGELEVNVEQKEKTKIVHFDQPDAQKMSAA